MPGFVGLYGNIFCGQTVNGTSPRLQPYTGTDGRVYPVGDRTCITLTKTTTNLRGSMEANVLQARGRSMEPPQYGLVQGAITWNGIQIMRFYGPEANEVNSSFESELGITVAGGRYLTGEDIGYGKGTVPPGDLCIVTFVPYEVNEIRNNLSSLDSTFKKYLDPGFEVTANMCLQTADGGFLSTPLPSASFLPTPEPTPTPSPTPVTPTPTVTPLPTATPIPANPVPGRLSPVGSNYTLSYSESVKGWPSFYSYSPDWMIGMNNFFYTYKGGNLYRHNTNEQRNNFYGIQYNSSLTSVINESPLDAKLFRNISLESDEPWTTTLSTDLDNPAFIQNSWYELKEGSWFASIKNTNQVPTTLDNFSSRSVIGIGRATVWSGLNTARQFDFINALDIGSQVSIGDYLYFNNELTNTPQLAGQITQININISQNINNVVINSIMPGTAEPITVDPYVIVVKDNTAESHGILGHYCLFTIVNYGPSPTELFAVQAELMKSYP